MNKIILVGNLVANPEFSIRESGLKMGKFRIAVNTGKEKSAMFINVIYFDKLAEQCQNYLQKGSMVLIDGRLNYNQDENKRDYYSIIANSVQFLKNLKVIEQTEEKIPDVKVSVSEEKITE